MTDRALPPDGYGLPILDPRDAPTLSLLGHDLRAALSEVIGGLRLVETAGMDGENRLKIARTRAAGEALSLLLEQALSIMLGENDPTDTLPGLLQTDRLLDSICLRWEGRAREKGLDFQLEAVGLPPQLRVDGALMERVLANLLGNALKFAGTGCVTCRISVVGNHLAIAVRDEGPGFAENALPRLFQVNSRPKNAAKPGTGLGLHIVRDMVDRAGGRIVARNRPEGGAEVSIDLPLPGPPQPTLATRDLSRCRVLVADDNATSRAILRQHLCQMGAEVIIAADGVEAVGRLERESFDLALIDIEMPRMGGLEVIRYLRATPGLLSKLPVLAITAHTGQAMQDAIRAAGADAVLSKPVICPLALASAIAKAMGALGLPDIDPTVFDRLLAMAGPQTAAELVDRFLEDLQAAERHLTAARHGPNWASIRAQTHVLIALAGTAGAHQLQGRAEQLNQLAHSDTHKRDDLTPLFDETLQGLQAMILFVAGKKRHLGGPA
jgi:CheY-like chemotaxis protein/HPt (histidine-containing phosphotransfer) domain-containing protein/anti-sigma regulatory factor (Ser/Thr protein kinase)